MKFGQKEMGTDKEKRSAEMVAKLLHAQKPDHKKQVKSKEHGKRTHERKQKKYTQSPKLSGVCWKHNHEQFLIYFIQGSRVQNNYNHHLGKKIVIISINKHIL